MTDAPIPDLGLNLALFWVTVYLLLTFLPRLGGLLPKEPAWLDRVMSRAMGHA